MTSNCESGTAATAPGLFSGEGREPTWQYGVMFNDGSVSRSWNGNTQEPRAMEYAAKMRADYPRDNIRVVRRLIGPWEQVCSCGKPFPEDGGAEGVCECCSTCVQEPATS